MRTILLLTIFKYLHRRSPGTAISSIKIRRSGSALW